MICPSDSNQFKSNKIVDMNFLENEICYLKSIGKTVGLCVGNYDLLHPGHILHLKSAKKFCDILVVGVTCDKFVRDRKGPGRPIFNEILRAFSLSELSSVDYVVISPFKTAVEVIHKLKPNFYIKGPDYVNKKTPGIESERFAINEIGGKIIYTNDEKMSTSNIIKEILKLESIKNEILIIIDRDGTLIEDRGFLGKNDNWKSEIVLNENTVSLLKYLDSKAHNTKIVITNQTGVARGFFTEQRVIDINRYIDNILRNNGINIDDWNYCPHADRNYAEKSGYIFVDSYVIDKTKRKPSIDMILESLGRMNKSIFNFKKIFVIGDREEDKKLSENLNAYFIDIRDKKIEELKKKIDELLTFS